MSDTMTERVGAFISRHGLLSMGLPQLVAVSGGADSVCLLLVLRELGYRVEALHCNFRLRGDESDRDEQFVASLCRRLSVPLHLTHFDTLTYARLHKVSIEMAARELRYGYFEQLRRDIGAERVCVAHHSDDSVETILLNLVRGTGLHGLTGIKPRNGNVVRPLLCVSRSDIVQWLQQRGQEYVTDSTNLVADVMRNKLRLNVIPQLRAITPSASENILSTARRLAEGARVYDAAVEEALQTLVADNGIEIDTLLRQPSPEALLFEWLTPMGFTPSAVEAVSRSLTDCQAGRRWQSATHLLVVHQGRLVAGDIPAERPVMRIPETGVYIYNNEEERFRLEISEGSNVVRRPSAASLDADRVAFPLTVRPVAAGDRFRPFGMKGTKLVSDFLADRKVLPFDRMRQLVVTDAEGHILWLVGHRPDGRYCITPLTQRTLTIEVLR